MTNYVLLTNGKIYAWGLNGDYNMLGFYASSFIAPSPVLVPWTMADSGTNTEIENIVSDGDSVHIMVRAAPVHACSDSPPSNIPGSTPVCINGVWIIVYNGGTIASGTTVTITSATTIHHYPLHSCHLELLTCPMVVHVLANHGTPLHRWRAAAHLQCPSFLIPLAQFRSRLVARSRLRFRLSQHVTTLRSHHRHFHALMAYGLQQNQSQHRLLFRAQLSSFLAILVRLLPSRTPHRQSL